MSDAAVIANPDPYAKRLQSPDRKVRMKEKLRRMPEGTFTFAPHLQGAEKHRVHETIIDRYMEHRRPPKVFDLAPGGVFLARFQRAA